MLAYLASKALRATCSPENIRAGFKKTDIYPFNHQALDFDFGPSTVFEEDGESSCNSEDDSAQGEDVSTEHEGESTQGDVASLEMADDDAQEKLSKKLSQLSIEEKKILELQDLWICKLFQFYPLHVLDMIKAKSFLHIHPHQC